MPAFCKGICKREEYSHMVREIRGNHKLENKNKSFVKCTTCEIGIYLENKYQLTTCFCCNIQIKHRKVYKPSHEKNRIDDMNDKIRVKVIIKNPETGDKFEIYKIVSVEEAKENNWEQAQIINL